LSDGVLHGARQRSNWIQAAMDVSIGPVLAMLHDAPEKPWTVTSLAKRAHLAKSAFSERFRQAVGQPPLKYLTEYRIDKACRLLRHTQLGVKEIAACVGYESASSFSNAFKRWVGMAPADYRKNGNGVCHVYERDNEA
jgi:AraC-like DNA-binding protein